ncbi:glycine--tRNA ligase subunit beta [Stagnihabitans tardus]|uniref:Glycine--tRNA ligase beta subunit n=1 Tax=Stagnihabitans tardus TaxID=2699202 RepID=A0AAE4YC52_9RHOB|nr:glycine--tRNA ligase subunit beta [Stagnihabitans tardus]NBZ88937.1 glycine--tRNA ligase subunit beta [Stagnihabitans tardus]
MDLLIELFSEEIPARMQPKAREDLKSMVTQGLVDAGLTYASAGAFSTPRRLTLSVEGLSAESRPVREERKGPPVEASPPAIEGFLRTFGISHPTASAHVQSLLETPGAVELRGVRFEDRLVKDRRILFAIIDRPGRKAPEIIAEVLEATIRTFPWPKSMRWGSGSLRWVRPLHSILCLLSDETGAHVVPLTVDGITSTNTTEGHRFLSKGRFPVTGFDDYAVKLKRAHVVLDQAEREAAILQGAQNLAFAAGLELVEDKGLLTEIAGLVEWPVPLMGRIAEDFLHLPPEVLQTSMKEHQKFFSVRNPRTGRIEAFVTVANTETVDHGATILKGNLKVLGARLSDARFFWDKDLRVAKAGMGEWLEGLRPVTFHNKLGSQADRIARIEALAREIAPLVGADPEVAARAARLAKADLRSAMVGEFPELQGKMGRYYALEAGESPEVANAARDHYSPLGPSDAVPTEPVSVAVALADKLDTLTGFWAIDEKPTGSKDPFALRRAALGVIRLVLGNEVHWSLREITVDSLHVAIEQHFEKRRASLTRQLINDIDEARRVAKEYEAAQAGELTSSASLWKIWEKIDAEGSVSKEAAEEMAQAYLAREMQVAFQTVFANGESLLAFFHDRLKVFLKDQGIRHDVIDACLALPGNDDLTLLVKRAEALAAFLKSEDGPNLLQGFKRANTILTQAEQKDGVEYSFGADIKFAETDEERALFAALDAAEKAITPAMRAEDFPAAMAAMATLRAPIDAFFTATQINSDNQVLRRNRLNLLHRIRAICSGVADLTRIEG